VAHLREVLQRLEKNGLVLNGEKCVLGVKEVKYLGHVIFAGGVRPLPVTLSLFFQCLLP